MKIVELDFDSWISARGFEENLVLTSILNFVCLLRWSTTDFSFNSQVFKTWSFWKEGDFRYVKLLIVGLIGAVHSVVFQ